MSDKDDAPVKPEPPSDPTPEIDEDAPSPYEEDD